MHVCVVSVFAVAGKCCGCQVHAAKRNRHLLVGWCVFGSVKSCHVMGIYLGCFHECACVCNMRLCNWPPFCSAQLEGDTDQRSYVFNYYLKAVVTGYNERTGMRNPRGVEAKGCWVVEVALTV